MSALVLKICSEYAKALGLSFPPCTQQEINAICEWVDKHTIKDMTISQDGYNVTFTFKTENDMTKEFTFTIPKVVDIDELEKVLVGSESVVVNRSENNSKLQVRLAQSVLNDINSKLAKPTNPSSDSVVTMTTNGMVGTKPLSEIGGGTVYIHNIMLNAQFTYNDNVSGDFLFSFTSSRQTKYKLQDLTTIFNAFGSNIITTATIRKQETGGMPYSGIANVVYSDGADILVIRAFTVSDDTVTGYYKTGSLGNITSLQDTVTPL